MVKPSLVLTTITALLIQSIRAIPHEQVANSPRNLAQRDNKFKLKCGNAPDVVAGDFLHPSSVPAQVPNHRLTTPPPLSGSSENFMDYLWCTPNTTTYTFFGVGNIEYHRRHYDIYSAFDSAMSQLTTYLKTFPDGPILDGKWNIRTTDAGIEIYVQNSKGTMTYGVLLSSLKGLKDVVEMYIAPDESKSVIFQVNDGEWGELGVGYVGYSYVEGEKGYVCDTVGSMVLDCEDVKKGLLIV